jgi:hypothetical protein
MPQPPPSPPSKNSNLGCLFTAAGALAGGWAVAVAPVDWDSLAVAPSDLIFVGAVFGATLGAALSTFLRR